MLLNNKPCLADCERSVKRRIVFISQNGWITVFDPTSIEIVKTDKWGYVIRITERSGNRRDMAHYSSLNRAFEVMDTARYWIMNPDENGRPLEIQFPKE